MSLVEVSLVEVSLVEVMLIEELMIEVLMIEVLMIEVLMIEVLMFRTSADVQFISVTPDAGWKSSQARRNCHMQHYWSGPL